MQEVLANAWGHYGHFARTAFRCIFFENTDAYIHCLDKRCKGILVVTGHAERSGLQDLRPRDSSCRV